MLIITFVLGRGLSIQGQNSCYELGSNGEVIGTCLSNSARLALSMDGIMSRYDLGSDDAGTSIVPDIFSMTYTSLPSGDHALGIFDESPLWDNQRRFISLHYAWVQLSALSPISASIGTPTLAVSWDDAAAVIYDGGGWTALALTNTSGTESGQSTGSEGNSMIPFAPTEARLDQRGIGADAAFGPPGGMETSRIGDSVLFTFFGGSPCMCRVELRHS